MKTYINKNYYFIQELAEYFANYKERSRLDFKADPVDGKVYKMSDSIPQEIQNRLCALTDLLKTDNWLEDIEKLKENLDVKTQLVGDQPKEITEYIFNHLKYYCEDI